MGAFIASASKSLELHKKSLWAVAGWRAAAGIRLLNPLKTA
jgi:hypothetical protein